MKIRSQGFFFEKFKFSVNIAVRLRICVSFADIYNVEHVDVLTMTWTWSYVRSKDRYGCLQ